MFFVSSCTSTFRAFCLTETCLSLKKGDRFGHKVVKRKNKSFRTLLVKFESITILKSNVKLDSVVSYIYCVTTSLPSSFSSVSVSLSAGWIAFDRAKEKVFLSFTAKLNLKYPELTTTLCRFVTKPPPPRRILEDVFRIQSLSPNFCLSWKNNSLVRDFACFC